ncbi:MAG: InlB B-repeat-containing protein, partial [Clostridia bacterium]|nr:InlB B-repeat-containing protein [Clostridia bacterium]
MMKKQRLLTLALSCACVFISAAAFGIWSLDTEKANAAWTNDGGAVKATSQKSAVVYEYEDYVVAQNEDFGGATTLSWGTGDATSGLTLKNDLPTASFVYKFSYTPNDGGQTALALRSSYWGDYHFVFKGKTLQYNLKAGYVAVGEVFTDGPQLVEVGAIEIKNSDLTWFFLKVNGEEKMSATAANVPEKKSISVWGDQTAKIAQYSYDVSFNGEVKEVLAGQAIGTLPETPANENELLGWFDQDGNQVTAETVVTKDLTVTAVFAEPHNVTFTVDGEVYETYENVAYNTAIGELPVAPKKAGYDFVKWTYGGEEVTAETVVSAHMTVVAEYAERGYYIDEELEDYVVAQNDDFGGAATLSWGGDATSGLKLNNDLPTASFVYKFNFTPNAGGGQTALALRSDYWGSYHFVIKGKTLQYNLNASYVMVGEVFTDGPQLVEVGAIEIKDSDLTWFFLKVNGEEKMSATAANVPEKKSISAWGNQTAVLAQYSYDVSFTGIETREVLVGEQI